MVVLFIQCKGLDIKATLCTHSRKINIGCLGQLRKKRLKCLILRQSDTDRAIFFQFICLAKETGEYFSLKYTNLM